MSTVYPDIFAAMAAPFRANEERARHDGKKYITARAVMNRLDEVLGPENWSAEFTPWGQDAVYCTLTITLPDGEMVRKNDVGANSQLAEKSKGADPGEDDKGGVADALKRAAVQFGVGRYLYGDGTPRYARAGEPPRDTEPAPPVAANGHAATAAPKERHDWPTADHGEAARAGRGGKSGGKAPRDGRALYAWAKGEDEENEYGLVKYLGGWAKRQGWDGRMSDWDESQVTAGHAEGLRRIETICRSAEFQRDH